MRRNIFEWDEQKKGLHPPAAAPLVSIKFECTPSWIPRWLLNGGLVHGGLVWGPFRFRKLKKILKHCPRAILGPGSRPGPIHLK